METENTVLQSNRYSINAQTNDANTAEPYKTADAHSDLTLPRQRVRSGFFTNVTAYYFFYLCPKKQKKKTNKIEKIDK